MRRGRRITKFFVIVRVIPSMKDRKIGRVLRDDRYYVAYMPIILSCISFMFIEMKFIYCHSCVIFFMKSITICND